MSNTTDQHSLEPALEKAEAELAKHLDEACEQQGEDVGEASLDDLLRLEEELLAAARAADQTVRIRRRLEERGPGDRRAEESPSDRVVTQPPQEPAGGRVREFRDRQGRAWRAWEVRPGLGRPVSQLHRYLGDLVNGWLAFACLDDEARKRLPKFPPDWLEMSNQELEALLNQAAEVPRKEARSLKVEG
jgi:hypothetical protein